MTLHPRNEEVRASGWSRVPDPDGMTLPDIPGIVHGVKSVDPYVLQCDGCLAVFEQGDMPLVTFLQTVTFHHPERGQFNPRMCADCWGAEGVKTMNTGRVS